MDYVLTMKIAQYIKEWSNNKGDILFVRPWFGCNKTKNVLSFQPDMGKN